MEGEKINLESQDTANGDENNIENQVENFTLGYCSNFKPDD